MTVAQLIDALKMFDPDDIVLVDGYEGGLCDVEKSNVYKAKFNKNINTGHWDGPHNEDENGEFYGVVIGRMPSGV